MPMVPFLATLPYFSQHTPTSLWYVPHDQLKEKDKPRARFADGCIHYPGNPQQRAAALESLPRTFLKDNGEGKLSQ